MRHSRRGSWFFFIGEGGELQLNVSDFFMFTHVMTFVNITIKHVYLSYNGLTLFLFFWFFFVSLHIFLLSEIKKGGGVIHLLPPLHFGSANELYTQRWRHRGDLFRFLMSTLINHRTPLFSSSKKEVID